MSKILDSVVELNKIQYNSGNNTLNFTATPISGGAPIVDATAGIYANAAFIKANAAFNKANSAVSRQSFLANTGQTLFITNGYNVGYVDVFVNGIKLYSAEDFTATDGANVSISQPTITQNDVVEIINWGGTAEPIARVDQYARDYVNNAWTAANSAYNFANSVYGLANNAANSAASSIPLTGSSNISGNLLPSSTNTYYLGSETNRWHSLYVGPGSIDLGGLILSNSGGTLSVASPGSPATPIAGEDTWVRAQANAAFVKANSVYDANTTNTSFFSLPVGNTAQRPANAANGALRYNTTLGRIEGYLHSAGWTSIVSDSYSVEYLIIAGGGAGGGQDVGGGGGAGGVLNGTTSVTPFSSYTVIIGAGGTGATPARGANGTSSSALSQTALGGGGGGAGNASGTGVDANRGYSGGSGGGGSWGLPGAPATSGQGYAGGNDDSGATPSAGGGGGAGGVGGAANSVADGRGGLGGTGTSLYSTWASATTTGSGGYYAAGGGGGGDNSATASSPGGGGTGGYRNGNPSTSLMAGASNTGSGGGGSGGYSGGAGGSGGSGIVILRYVGSQRGTGGTISSSGGYTYHTFTGSGTFTA